MEWAFVVILVLGVPIVLAIWLIVRAINARERIETLTRRIETLELEIHLLKKRPEGARQKPAEQPAEAPAAEETIQAPEPEFGSETVIFRKTPLTTTPPPAPHEASGPAPSAMPPPIPPMPASVPIKATFEIPAPKALPKINWEQFMGVKMFAWVGGLALFLGVAFFVKYSFEKNLISPELRVAFGFIAGLGLLVGGVVMSRKDYATLSQTLCATGVLVLYAVTYSCRAVYDFPFFGPVPTFVLMVLITATAFLLAVRLNALVVAILGMLGGFLTPYLLSLEGRTIRSAFLDISGSWWVGVLLVALHRRWFFLASLAAAGTIVMQVGWAARFFTQNRYFDGNQIFIPLGVLLGFNALYLAASWWASKREGAFVAADAAQADQRRELWWFRGSMLALAAVALAFTAWFLTFPTLAARPWIMFGFVILIDLAVVALCALDRETASAQPIAGMAVFGLLALWTSRSLNNNLLNAALAFYFIFAVIHSVIPAWLQRRHGGEMLRKAGLFFPPLALLLVLIPIFQLAEVSFMVWPFVLLVDLVAIVLAVASGTIVPVAAVLVLTLCATGALIFKIPATLTGLSTSFFLLGAFAIFFAAAGVWLARRFKPDLFAKGAAPGGDLFLPENLVTQLPALSAVLPFLLLIMATLRLPLANPSPVFGVALLLVVLLLGVTKLFAMDWMAAIGLVCVISLECTWHFSRFHPADPVQPLTWYLLFLAVFTAFPFLFFRQFSTRIIPWATAAMAGPAQFFLIHRLMRASYPNEVMGLLPAAFAVIPLVSLVAVLKLIPPASSARMAQLAWYGGVGLFFITLIFPIQFDHQWITIGWGLEGAALLWLFHRLPHPGLRLAGVGLLAVAFARLALNPAVLGYHTRSATPIFNWFLYAYGIVTICLFAGAWLLAPPRDRIGRLNVPAILTGLGTILAFWLVNIEIADFFGAPGSRLSFYFFQFGGGVSDDARNFARDMTYSIAWAVFALILLVVGIMRNQAGARYAGLALLSVTLLKLFLHDLARLGQLYRIGAFMAVAVIAMLASFAYQRFFIAAGKMREAKNETTSP